ncbi:uncharacterized protein LOC100889105 [Strongylocentrotus purpuratus]|uniref:Flavodoxin domain-containing protein n=1 Tax=Strongylocentrotus purpuratus TaxID=7668 RepID=A0A7M7GIP5_STRPU|nr:uncharacterized protein LOC100889105 [Strongylocentrotus purpuratus]|eukprot:XP_003728842.1 PREDICTED: uncharacterized protein LOC100889105 isoform X1 [Strongylocentrotus purpuratus]
MTSSKKVKVAVYSGSNEENVAGLIKEIMGRMSDCVAEVKFVPLPYNVSDMLKMKLDKKYYMLLCHSIENRRFSITNVTDALYDDFLRKAKKKLGRRNVGVIAHDFESAELSPERLESRMESFRNTQERTFRKSILQLIGGKLSESPVELNSDQWEELGNYFRNKLKKPKPKPRPAEPKMQMALPCLCARGTRTEQ